MDATLNDPLVGRVLDGRYRVDARVAAGGMATVYRALDTRLDRTVALKVMHVGLAQDPEFTRRFILEAKAAARLSHPNVVNVFDQGTDGALAYLTMEFVEGRTLRELLTDLGNMTPREAFGVLEPMLAALAAAHRAGFVHRDVKPENVLISDDGGIKLGDFGLARATTTTATAATGKVMVGTVAYLAPEQVERGESTPRSDVYAAGVVLYEMLTGRQPHHGATAVEVIYKHVHTDVPPPSQAVPGLSHALDTLVRAATVRDPEQRPIDAEALLTFVRRIRHAMPDAELDFGAALRLPPAPEPLNDNATSVFRVNEVLLPPHLAPLGLSVDSMEDEQARYGGTSYGQQYAENHEYAPAGADAGAGATVADAPGSGYPRQPGVPGGRRRKRGPSRGVIVLAVVLLIAAGIGGGAWWYGSGRYTDVPGVLTMAKGPAESKLKAADLKVEYEKDGVFSETVPKDSVVSTDPGPGKNLLRGSTVKVKLSMGPERYVVPPLANLSLDDAKKALTEKHLTMGKETRVPNAKPPGIVVSSKPNVGEVLQRDTTVELVVSRGPDTTLPDLTNLTVDDARSRFQPNQNLTVVEDPNQQFSDTIPAGRIISANPGANTTVPFGTKITVVVSKGPDLVQVPPVTGMNPDDAAKALAAVGLRVNNRMIPLIPANVGRQDPAAGSMVKRDSEVFISNF
ncbi:Stk1 family PASTA domain-containing Ser/Thr kinase [Streptomyces sp. SID3343]|uniref:Stk1 family PASTA domain-containing Ser/Thr kinase n=1 Tax=Streptomyces sp. SID3343 TaxID=2690260 RepID=UPI001367A687|nr:Stk1 family PASTA domain-containing Ser/Thr kinase [Streptomyces sp. SID3343]